MFILKKLGESNQIFQFLTKMELLNIILLFVSSLYSEKQFKCKDGSQKISMSHVNDDYCDCLDGSDEPGTSACSNGKFFCQNKGHKVQAAFRHSGKPFNLRLVLRVCYNFHCCYNRASLSRLRVSTTIFAVSLWNDTSTGRKLHLLKNYECLKKTCRHFVP